MKDSKQEFESKEVMTFGRNAQAKMVETKGE